MAAGQGLMYSAVASNVALPGTTTSILQLAAPVGPPVPILIHEWRLTSSKLGDNRIVIAIQRMTVSDSGGSGIGPVPLNPLNTNLSFTSVRASTSIAGTVGNVLESEIWTTRLPYSRIYTEAERIYVPGGGIISLGLVVVPAGFNVTAECIFEEL